MGGKTKVAGASMRFEPRYEVYKLTCWRCGREVEFRAGRADMPELRRCPTCGGQLDIQWRNAA